MIVDKKQNPVDQETKPKPIEPPVLEGIAEAVATNPLIDAHLAVEEILKTIKVDPDNPNSESYFKTIRVDNGQLARIKGSKLNEEYGVSFPAVFIHYIDVYANVGASRISENKGVMRIHYVLNNLNNSDHDAQFEGYRMLKRIMDAIESNKHKFPALVSRFQYQYWDQPLSFDDGLQPYWIDYQIWFQDYTGYAYKNYVDVFLTQPPFTQPSDQNEIANPDNMSDYKEPAFEDVASFEDFDS